MKDTYYTTFTVNNWVSIFQDFPETKDLLIESLRFISKRNWVEVYAFVIMRDHVHIAWRTIGTKSIEEVGLSFKKFTGIRIIRKLKLLDKQYLEMYFNSQREDRKFHFWKTKTQHYKMQHKEILKQKINYIHNNPTKGFYKTCNKAEEYIFSSALSYKVNHPEFEFLKLIDL